MLHLEYHQLDVFTDRVLGGNALAVFPEAGGLSDELMQALARETNLSETTFITARDRDSAVYSVRIFTPYREVEFAGHPTIGTAWLLLREPGVEGDEITLDLKVGMVPVGVDRGERPPLVHFTAAQVAADNAVEDADLLSRLYGLPATDLDLDRCPAQIVRFGIAFLIVPVRSREALERVSIDLAALHQLADRHGCDLVTAFSMDAYQRGSMASTRVFAPLHGVPEDPATGSSASCLAWYLRRHGLIPDCGEDWLRLDQGYSCARPSLIHLRASQDGAGRIQVQVGGQVVPAAKGMFTV